MNTFFKKACKYISTPRLFLWKALCELSPLVKNDKLYVELQFLFGVGKWPNLKNPRTWREKLAWLKLYWHNPEMPVMVDKHDAKNWITERIGEGHVVPLLGTYNSFDEIDIESLPSRFVLKCTHDSHSFSIIDKSCNPNWGGVKSTLNKGLGRNYYYLCREWPYRNLKPRIIAEQFLDEDGSGCLTDYKFFCFGGEPYMMYVSKDVADNATTDFFDMHYNRLDLRLKDPNSKDIPLCPQEFEEMKEYSRKLSSGFPHLRVDFYVVKHKVYVGELTFFHNGGIFPIHPEKWDVTLGNMITLPSSR